MTKKVETSSVGVPRGQKLQILGGVGSGHSSASQHPGTPPNLQKTCNWVFFNIPPNFKPKH